MGYKYDYQDTSAVVTVGSDVASLNYVGCIQQDDGYGGTNHSFSIPGKTGLYHVHFNSNGRKVNVVRYKSSSSDAGGSNIVKWFNSGGVGTERQNLKGLARGCDGYPNHAKLFQNLHDAINR